MIQQHLASIAESDDGFREMIYTCGPLITIVMMWLGMMAYFKLQDRRLHKFWDAEDKRRKEDKEKSDAAWRAYGEETLRRLEPLFESLSEKDKPNTHTMSTQTERPSAATSRENEKQTDQPAPTGGELAAAPCSAGEPSEAIWSQLDDLNRECAAERHRLKELGRKPNRLEVANLLMQSSKGLLLIGQCLRQLRQGMSTQSQLNPPDRQDSGTRVPNAQPC